MTLISLAAFSCKKRNLEPEVKLDPLDDIVLKLSDIVYTVSGNTANASVDILYLYPENWENEITQGLPDSLNFNPYFSGVQDYKFFVDSTVKLAPAVNPDYHSTLILFDKSDEYIWNQSTNVWYDCFQYWLHQIDNQNEYAIGGFASGFDNGFKVYSDGFFNGTSTEKEQYLFDMVSEEEAGSFNIFEAADPAIDYIYENGKHSYKNIIFFTDEEPGETDLNPLINKAQNNDVSISIMGPGNWDYNSISSQTGGFYCSEYSFNNSSIRLLLASIDKIETKNYSSFRTYYHVEKEIGNLGSGWLGYYIIAKTFRVYVYLDL